MTARTATSLADLTARDLVAAYREHRLSPVEVIDAVIVRIEASEPTLNALYAFDPDGARAAAQASRVRWAKGEPAGPIDGVPVTLKDNLAMAGVPTPLGTAASEPRAGARRRAAHGAYPRGGRGDPRQEPHRCPITGMLSSGAVELPPRSRATRWEHRDENPAGSSAGSGRGGGGGYGASTVGTYNRGGIDPPAAGYKKVRRRRVKARASAGARSTRPSSGASAGPMTRTAPTRRSR